MTLEEYLQQIRQELMDPSELIYPSEALGAALRHALSVYNRACPQTTGGTAQVDEDGRIASLDDLSGLVDVLEVMAGDEEVRGWVQYSDGTSTCLLLDGDLLPGAELQVRYTCAHSIAGLDGATLTSVTGQDEILLASGAAGYAACGQAARRAQGFDPLPAGRGELQTWGRAVLEEFRSELYARRPRAGTVAAWE